jgi:RNA polymerase sigma factor (sigma-70 family)
MATGQRSGVIGHLRKGALLADGGMTDGQLLGRFLGARDEAAFEALVRRHGPMVLGVCRRVLRNAHDAEDAFQAAFLVLAKKAASLTQRELVGNWLYGVAYRAALQTRAARGTRERQVSEMPEPEVVEPADVWGDLRPVLDEELNRLPEKYRAPVVLCDLEGRTRREVARQLGVPEGTLSGRLTTARRKLARRLTQRGLALSSGGLAAVLSQGAALAHLPAALVGSTTRAAIRVAAGGAAAAAVSAKVAAVTEGVLRTMFLSKLKGVAAVLCALLALGGTVLLGFRAAAADQEGARPAVADDRPAAGAGVQPAQPPADRARPREQARLAVQAGGVAIPVETDAMQGLAFSRDSRFLAGGGFGKEILIWDRRLKGDRPWRTLKGPKTFVRRVAFSPDGKLIAAGVDGAVIYLWAAASGKPVAELRATLPSKGIDAGIHNFAFLPGNKLVVSYLYQPLRAVNPEAVGAEIWIWDIGDIATKKATVLAKQEGGDIAVSPDGKLLACSRWVRRGLAVWDLERRKVVWEESVGKNEFMSRVAFSPDGKFLAVGGGYRFVGPRGGSGDGGRLWLFDVKTKKRLWGVEEEKNGAYNAIAFTADSKGVLTGSSGRFVNYRFKGGATGSKVLSELRRWDVANGKEVWRADGELGWFQTITASADGKTIAGCDNCWLMLFDPETGRRLSVLHKETRRP